MLHRLNLGLLAVALLALARLAAAAHFEICRGCRPWRALALPLARQVHHPEIMLGVLIKVFGRDPVAAGLRLPRERDITLEYLIGVAADFYVGPIAVESLHPVRQARPVVMRRTAACAAAASPITTA